MVSSHPSRNRRLLPAFLFALVLAGPSVPSAAYADDWSVFGADDMPSIVATEAMLVDGDGNMLYSRNGDDRMSMASITKVMTAVVALESGVPLDTEFTITNSVTELDPVSSIVGYQPGERVTLSDMIHGLLVHSGNDAALSIAECVAGSESAFVAMMNSKALELGLVNTHFANPHGLDQEGHYSTAADLIALGRHAMAIPLFASIVGSPSTVIDINGTPTTFASTDELLNVYPGMRGIKTGYTYGAGRAFLGVASRGGQTIYVCVLGNEDNASRWTDVSTLLDWAFAHYPSTTVAETNLPITGYAEFQDRFGWVLPTTVEVDAEVRTSPFVIEPDLTVTVDIDGLAAAGVNEEVGQVSWYEGDGLVSSRTISTTGTLLEKSSFGPFESSTLYELDRL